jgi:hypothetical protein
MAESHIMSALVKKRSESKNTKRTFLPLMQLFISLIPIMTYRVLNLKKFSALGILKRARQKF